MRARPRAPVLFSSGAVLLALATTGCEPKGIDIGALNKCGENVEVDVVTRADLADVDPAWTPIAPGERDKVRSVDHDADSAYLIVRIPGASHERRETVPLDELREPPDGADYDKEVVLTGRLCPR